MTLREHSEYEELKSQVVTHVANHERYSQLLSTLKELYRKDINSPRRYEQITKFGHLLRILEIRDLLSENNVGPLKQIAQTLPNSYDLVQRINNYESNSTPIQFVNLYASEKTQNTTAPEVMDSMTSNNTTNSLTKQYITEAIVEDIGYNWRDLARGLEIKEKTIDELNQKYDTFTEKAKCIMELYNKKLHDNETAWFFDLCDALETCRRGELVRKIKKIMAMNR